MKGPGRNLLRLILILVVAAAVGHVAATRSGYAQAVNGTLLGTNSILTLNNLTTNRAGVYCVG